MKELWKHQIEAIKRAEIEPNLGLFFEQGCLSKDTKIKINIRGLSRIYTIEKLYRRFNDVDLVWPEKKIKHDVFVRSLVDGTIRLNLVKGVYKTGVKGLFKITVSGKDNNYIKCTKDHKVYTKMGWKKAEQLTLDDYLAYDGLTKWKKKENPNKKIKKNYRALVVGDFYPNSYKHNHYRKAWTHRLIYEASYNKVSLEKYIAATYSKDFYEKYVSFSTKEYHVHHRDHDSLNNSLDNLVLMKKYDHMKLHGNYSNFGYGEITWRKVKSITKVGKEMTYDIECAHPYNSFTANNFIVHNSGKSRTVIDIIRRRCAEKGRLRRTLILAPLVVCQNWKEEFRMFSKINLSDILVLTKSGKMRERELVKHLGENLANNKIVITNYEAVQMESLYKMFLQWRPEILVCDESQRLKNSQGKRALLVSHIADMAEHKYILTGTPILNSPMDIFQQFRILDGGKTFGKNFFSFRATYFRDANERWKGKQSYYPKWEPVKEQFDVMQRLIQKSAIRVLKKDCLDLPPLVRQKIVVEMSAEQKRLYKEMADEYIAFIKSKEDESRAVVAQLAVTKALRLQQIVSGFGKDDKGEIHRIDCPRLKALQELLETITPNSKVIVWSVFKENYQMIREVCEKIGVKYREIHGDITNAERIKGMDEFRNDPEIRVIICNQAAAGVGINLIEASYSIYYSKNFSLEHDLQSGARNYRGGSEVHEKVTRIDLIAENTIDELVNEALSNKQNISDRILSWDVKKGIV